ncbi:unnamed protein product [Symbiodinium sp. CCMP2456]|nr:unnamed protein product [Symbiodinium sp. CCMP2456]
MDSESSRELCSQIREVTSRNIPAYEIVRKVYWIVNQHWAWRASQISEFEDAGNNWHALTWYRLPGDKWEEVAHWRLKIGKWGNFSGERAEDCAATAISLEELARELRRMMRSLDSQEQLKDEFWKLGCRIQKTLLENAEANPNLLGGDGGDIVQHVRTLVDDPDRSTIQRSGRETLVAVQLEHLLWRHRTRLSCSGLAIPKPEPIDQHDNAFAAQDQPTRQERVLALVAATANGEEHCLLRLRVSRAIFADQKVIYGSRIKLSQRRAFRFTTHSRRLVLARGFRTSWPWLKANSTEDRGEPLEAEDVKYYKTVGPGPELFAVSGQQVYYEDKKKWVPYNSSVLQEWSEIQHVEIKFEENWKEELKRVCVQSVYCRVCDRRGRTLTMEVVGVLQDVPVQTDFPLQVIFLASAERASTR